MGIRAWWDGVLKAHRSRRVLHHVPRMAQRLAWVALRVPVWLAIAILLLPSLAALLVAAAFELVLQRLLRVDEWLADAHEHI